MSKNRNILEAANINWKVDSDSLLFDLKFIMKEYYIGTFSENGESLRIKFNNGQIFEVTINEIA